MTAARLKSDHQNVKMPKRTARKISKKSPMDILPTKLLRWYEVLRIFPEVAIAVGKRSFPRTRYPRAPCSASCCTMLRDSQAQRKTFVLASVLRLTGFPSTECLCGRSKSVGGSICQYNVEVEALAFKSYWLSHPDVPHLFLLTSGG